MLLLDESELKKGQWAVPGDGLAGDEGFDDGAARILRALSRDTTAYMEQSRVTNELEHFNKGSLMTVGYFSTVSKKRFVINSSLYRQRILWWPLNQLPTLSLIHERLIRRAFVQLQSQVSKQPLGFYLLDNQFTIFQLQKLLERVLDKKYDRPNFRRKALATGLLEPLNVVEQDVSHRPAKLFRFNTEKYKLLERNFKFSF